MSDPQPQSPQPQNPQQPRYAPPPVPPQQSPVPPQYAPQPPAGYQAAPQYGPQYGSQPGPQYPYQQPAPYGYAVPTGVKFWALGFLYFIPYVGWIVTLIVSLVLNGSARRDPNPVVRENARAAANWSLTAVAATVLSWIIVFGSAMAGGATDNAGGNGDIWILPAFFGLFLMLAVGTAHLVICIMGTIQAQRQVFSPAIAIPFIKPIA